MLFENAFWKKLKSEIVPTKISSTNQGYYGLIHIVVDENGAPLLTKTEMTSSYLGFSSLEDVEKFNLNNSKVITKNFMIGDIVKELSGNKKIQHIKVNPYSTANDNRLLCEDVIICPIFDEITQKYMVTDPSEALALLAISPLDEKRIGLKTVFYSITNKNLPEDKDERQEVLQEKIEELSFIISRIPVERGSGSVLCVLLNLDNLMEETAFIRSYSTFDSYSDVIFVTSDLRIRTGELSTIQYDGSSIDTVFLPIIKWQSEKQSSMNL